MNSSNTYYVIGYYLQDTDGPFFVKPNELGDHDVSKAQRFASVTGAVQYATQKNWLNNTGWLLPSAGIVKVTETQTSNKTQLASTRVIDAAKPVALYNVPLKQYGVVRESDKQLIGTPDVANATAFTDLADALLALSVSIAVSVENGALGSTDEFRIVHVHQVSIAPAFSYTWEALP